MRSNVPFSIAQFPGGEGGLEGAVRPSAAYRKLFAIPLVLLADSWLLGSP